MSRKRTLARGLDRSAIGPARVVQKAACTCETPEPTCQPLCARKSQQKGLPGRPSGSTPGFPNRFRTKKRKGWGSQLWQSIKLALNCNSRRAVNLRDVAHVAQTFFARRLRLQPILDAVGEVVGFSLEVRRVARWVEFVKLPARTISAQPQSFVGRRPSRLRASLSIHGRDSSLPCGTVSRVATG